MLSLCKIRLRWRLWYLRRVARWWYEESISHRRSAELHRRAISHCLAHGNDRHRQAMLLEMDGEK